MRTVPIGGPFFLSVHPTPGMLGTLTSGIGSPSGNLGYGGPGGGLSGRRPGAVVSARCDAGKTASLGACGET